MIVAAKTDFYFSVAPMLSGRKSNTSQQIVLDSIKQNDPEKANFLKKQIDEANEVITQLRSSKSNMAKSAKAAAEEKRKEIGMIHIKEETNEKCIKCGKPMITRFSKFGKFYACSGYPACKTTKPFLYIVKNRKCPKCTGDIVVKFTKTRKKFYGCSNYPTCDFSSWALNKIPVPAATDEKKSSA